MKWTSRMLHVWCTIALLAQRQSFTSGSPLWLGHSHHQRYLWSFQGPCASRGLYMYALLALLWINFYGMGKIKINVYVHTCTDLNHFRLHTHKACRPLLQHALCLLIKNNILISVYFIAIDHDMLDIKISVSCRLFLLPTNVLQADLYLFQLINFTSLWTGTLVGDSWGETWLASKVPHIVRGSLCLWPLKSAPVSLLDNTLDKTSINKWVSITAVIHVQLQ